MGSCIGGLLWHECRGPWATLALVPVLLISVSAGDNDVEGAVVVFARRLALGTADVVMHRHRPSPAAQHGGVFRVRMARPRGNERAARRKAPIRGGMWRDAGSPPFSMVERRWHCGKSTPCRIGMDGVFRTSARRWSMGSTVGGGAGRKSNGIRRNTAREPPPRIPERSRTLRTFWRTAADLAASRGPLAKSPLM